MEARRKRGSLGERVCLIETLEKLEVYARSRHKLESHLCCAGSAAPGYVDEVGRRLIATEVGMAHNHPNAVRKPFSLGA